MKIGTPLTIGILAACTLLLLTGGIVSAQSDGTATLTSPTAMISNYQTSPAIFMPGDDGTLTVTITNTAQSATVKENTGLYQGSFATTKSTDINLFIENVHLEGRGILVKSPDFDRLGEIGPGQSLPVTFLIQAPDRDGIYFPEVWVDIKDGTSTRYPVPVNVNTHIAVAKKPEVVVKKSLPESVVPGDDFLAGITLVNSGDSRADDLAIAINSSTPSLSLVSPSNYYLGHLDAGQEKQINLQFSSDKNAPLGLRDVTVTLDYLNPDGTKKHQVEHLGIPVKGKAEVSIASLTTDPLRINPGDSFTMTVRIENTGTDDAKSVSASVDLPMTGNRQAFVGKIEPRNDAPAVFYLKERDSGDIGYNLSVQYTDDYGVHTVEKRLTLNVGQPNYAGPVLLIVIAAIAGAGYWYWRRKKD
nr:S-layer protein [uncultured Methanoregula sp.]